MGCGDGVGVVMFDSVVELRTIFIIIFIVIVVTIIVTISFCKSVIAVMIVDFFFKSNLRCNIFRFIWHRTRGFFDRT